MLIIKSWSEIPEGFTGPVNFLGAIYWIHLNGQFHREDGFVTEWENGDKEWYKNGKLHREDGPAAKYVDGTKHWFLNGKLFKTKEEWFQALTPQQKENALWSSELWK